MIASHTLITNPFQTRIPDASECPEGFTATASPARASSIRTSPRATLASSATNCSPCRCQPVLPGRSRTPAARQSSSRRDPRPRCSYGTAADTSSAPGDGPDETPEMDEDRACRRGPAFARATVLLGWHSRRDRSVLLCSDARAAEHAITTSETGGPDELGNYTRGMSGLLLATVAEVLLDDAVSRRH
jgi:hypothetical protein